MAKKIKLIVVSVVCVFVLLAGCTTRGESAYTCSRFVASLKAEEFWLVLRDCDNSRVLAKYDIATETMIKEKEICVARKKVGDMRFFSLASDQSGSLYVVTEKNDKLQIRQNTESDLTPIAEIERVYLPWVDGVFALYHWQDKLVLDLERWSESNVLGRELLCIELVTGNQTTLYRREYSEEPWYGFGMLRWSTIKDDCVYLSDYMSGEMVAVDLKSGESRKLLSMALAMPCVQDGFLYGFSDAMVYYETLEAQLYEPSENYVEPEEASFHCIDLNTGEDRALCTAQWQALFSQAVAYGEEVLYLLRDNLITETNLVDGQTYPLAVSLPENLKSLSDFALCGEILVFGFGLQGPEASIGGIDVGWAMVALNNEQPDCRIIFQYE